jgi:aspartyl-tRNA(Asn)/glutamyl-tRNA(Gln) amidotransferase subunit C
MSKINSDQVLAIAKLGKLQLSPNEVETFKVEISNILKFVDQLQEIDLSGFEPTYFVHGLNNVFREDQVDTTLPSPDALIHNVPQSSANYFKVKRMIV